MEEGKPTGGHSLIARLAAALDMPSSDLAAAIADEVREYVPPVDRAANREHWLVAGGLLVGFRYLVSLEVNGSNGLH